MEYCASLKNLKVTGFFFFFFFFFFRFVLVLKTIWLQSIENAPNFVFVKGNILSMDFMHYLMKTHKIDTVLHFAAQSHVDNSFGNSLEFTRTNTLGTHTLLEVARLAGAQLKLFM